MANIEDAGNPDLESFRQQWKAEVTQKKTIQNQAATRQASQPSTSAAAKASKRAPRRPSTVHHEPGPLSDLVKDGYYDEAEFSEEEEKAAKHERNKSKTGPLSTWKDGDMTEEDEVEKEPVSALDHYERAVERETQGQLGESLKLYQKAFKVSFITYR